MRGIIRPGSASRRRAGASILLVLLLIGALAGPARAHRVDFTVEVRAAVVVTFVYAGGRPFAHETCEIRRRADDALVFEGKTDAAGRVAFVPEGDGPWRARVFSADGHGRDFVFERPPAPEATPAPAPER